MPPYVIADAKTAGAAEVMHFIVDAVTGCKFEVTDPASEEVVLLKILQVSTANHPVRFHPTTGLQLHVNLVSLVTTALFVDVKQGIRRWSGGTSCVTLGVILKE